MDPIYKKGMSLDQVRDKVFILAFILFNRNKTHAARSLKVSIRHFRDKLREAMEREKSRRET